jgi:hypothetical protein
MALDHLVDHRKRIEILARLQDPRPGDGLGELAAFRTTTLLALRAAVPACCDSVTRSQ